MVSFHKSDQLDTVITPPLMDGVHLFQDIPSGSGVHQLSKSQKLSLAILRVIHVNLRLSPYTKHPSGIHMVSFIKNDHSDNK
jgi:hypothetical protein